MEDAAHARAAVVTASAKRPVPSAPDAPCFHCGTACRGPVFNSGDKPFCCQGCLTVFELLSENGLGDFYKLSEGAGVRIKQPAQKNQYKFLDESPVRERLVDFSNERITRVTFRIPAVHCIACVWLLENLFRLQAGVGQSQVNFQRKEVAVTFENAKLKLSELVELLTSLGYEPDLKLSDLESRPKNRAARRLWLQIGVAGFAFGNIMLLSISSYFGLDSFSGPGSNKLFGSISFLLALPVFFYSAADYWKSAWISLRRRMLTIDVPIAAGIFALFGQSTVEVFSGRGAGYFDSLAGLLFFLLCGKLFQQKTYDRLAFDRDYKSFFPLSITRRSEQSEERVSLSQLRRGDRLLLRNGELIPADSQLIEGPALIDYSFVTGEAEPVAKNPGDYLYAGGRQVGSTIEVETVRAVSQSYLTSLWGQEAFRKDKGESLNTLTNRYSQRFTKLIVAIALGAALFWTVRDSSRALKSFTSVLIVACPCALALAAPFALGTAQRLLAQRDVFLKNPAILETLARVDSVVFDKTGTLTASGLGSVVFHGTPLTEEEKQWLYSLTKHSTHPYSVRIGEALGSTEEERGSEPVRSFRETAGCGIEGTVAGHEIRLGSAAWLEFVTPKESRPHETTKGSTKVLPAGSSVSVEIDRQARGCFVLASAVRPQTERLLKDLSANYELALLSGDNEKEQMRFRQLLGPSAHLHFHQSPLDKLNFIRQLQQSGKTVLMVGDGLNDAGALKQADVGVAVVENVRAFSPASDLILYAAMVRHTAKVLGYAKHCVRLVRTAFLISAFYNVIGVSIAASGRLSPVVCAILMPLSSVSVVAYACLAAKWTGRGIQAREVERKARSG